MAHLSLHSRLIADTVRTDAYQSALRERITPDSVVLDIGTGTGLLALIACRLGAKRVHAVEVDETLRLARAVAKDNDCSERIEFLQGLSTQIELPERADVIVSDLHGVLPLFRRHLPSIVDARERLLAPGGVLIPERELLWGAIVEAPLLYGQMVGAWDGQPYGLDMQAVREMATNSLVKGQFTADQLVTPSVLLATLDYMSLEQSDFVLEATMTAARDGAGHGIAVWFDAILAPGIEISNAPGQPEMIYGQAFFPWPHPVELRTDDTISVVLWATLLKDDYAWTWKTSVRSAGEPGRILTAFEQSTLFLGHFS